MIGIVLAMMIGALCFFNTAAYAVKYGASICNSNGYSCYVTKSHDTWNKLFPDDTQRDLVMRINRMNERLHPGMRIAIPTSTDTDLLDYSPFPHQISAPGSKFIYVSLNRQAFAAYDADGTLERWGPVSSALGYCPDIERGCHTPTGVFHIISKEGSECVSSKFPIGDGPRAPMPYCMFFHGGFALHGSYELPGFNASHGCVRMDVDDARWLNEEFTDDEPNMTVIVKQF